MRAGWGCYSLGKVYVSATTICAKAFITQFIVTVLGADGGDKRL
jgi:hypothetical protein